MRIFGIDVKTLFIGFLSLSTHVDSHSLTRLGVEPCGDKATNKFMDDVFTTKDPFSVPALDFYAEHVYLPTLLSGIEIESSDQHCLVSRFQRIYADLNLNPARRYIERSLVSCDDPAREARLQQALTDNAQQCPAFTPTWEIRTVYVRAYSYSSRICSNVRDLFLGQTTEQNSRPRRTVVI